MAICQKDDKERFKHLIFSNILDLNQGYFAFARIEVDNWSIFDIKMRILATFNIILKFLLKAFMAQSKIYPSNLGNAIKDDEKEDESLIIHNAW